MIFLGNINLDYNNGVGRLIQEDFEIISRKEGRSAPISINNKDDDSIIYVFIPYNLLCTLTRLIYEFRIRKKSCELRLDR